MAKKESRIGHLIKAACASRKSLEVYRDQHLECATYLAGNRYGDNAHEKTTYINLLALFRQIYCRSMIAKAPRVMLSTFDRKMEPAVKAEQNWINEQTEEINLGNTLQRAVDDALITIGICKVALATPADASGFAWKITAGDPFARIVSLDDWVMDMNARDFDELLFMGHRYRAIKEVIVESKLYDKKWRDQLAVSNNSRYNAEGDLKLSAMGKEDYSDDEEYEEMVDLWEIYCPRHGCVYTFSDDDMSGPSGGYLDEMKPGREQKWIGPDQGPYHFLAYNRISGNLMPKGPMLDVLDLHIDANGIYRKMMRQANRLKQNTFVKDQDEAARAKKLADGEIGWSMNAKENIVQLTQGGIDPGLALAFREVFERFTLMGGNLLTLGGLSPQAGTLGQEELLAQQSGGQIASMQQTTNIFAKSVMRAMCYYWWNDPVNIQKVNYEVKEAPIQVPQEIHPWTSNKPGAMKRTGDMPKVDIDIYSMRASSPQQRANDLLAFTKVYGSMAQLFQQRGIVLDVQYLTECLADYQNLPELRRLLNIQEPMAEPEGGGGEGQAAPESDEPNTVYRRDVGGPSTRGDNAEMESSLEKMATSGGAMNGTMNGSMKSY